MGLTAGITSQQTYAGSPFSEACGRISNMQNTLTCVYCGTAYPEGTPPHGSQILTDHIKVCEKHPLRAAEITITKLRTIIVGLVGVDGKEKLKQMEKDIMTLNVPLQDKIVILDAIDGLLDTIEEENGNLNDRTCRSAGKVETQSRLNILDKTQSIGSANPLVIPSEGKMKQGWVRAANILFTRPIPKDDLPGNQYHLVSVVENPNPERSTADLLAEEYMDLMRHMDSGGDYFEFQSSRKQQ